MKLVFFLNDCVLFRKIISISLINSKPDHVEILLKYNKNVR